MKKIELEYWLNTYRQLQDKCDGCRSIDEALLLEDVELVAYTNAQQATIQFLGGEFDIEDENGVISVADEFLISREHDYGPTQPVSFYYLKLQHEEYD